MPATRKSPDTDAIAPEQRRDEIISIMAAGLARLAGAGPAPAAPAAARASMPANTPASMAAKKLSESVQTGLELHRETRLSVPAG